MQQIVRMTLEPDEILFVEGEASKGLYVVESGLLKLYKVSREGREQILATYGLGHTLSELPTVDGGLQPFCSAAVIRSAVLLIPGATIQQLCRLHAGCAQQMLHIVARRLRNALGMIEELSFSTVRTRLVAYLLRLAAPVRAQPNAAYLHLSGSQEIAAQIGTVREVVSRHLSRLQEQDLIRINQRTVHIPDVRRLATEIADASLYLTHEARNPEVQAATEKQAGCSRDS